MSIKDYISRLFPRLYGDAAILKTGHYLGWDEISCLPFGELVFRNCVELLTDLGNDVEWTLRKGDPLNFARFVAFFEEEAQAVLWRVYRYGYAVIGIDNELHTISLLDRDDYREIWHNDTVTLKALNPNIDIYVMKSPVYREEAKSDYRLCEPFVKFLDNTCNASNTAGAKMGAFVVASPQTAGAAPTPVVLSKTDKVDMEKEIAKEYGLLNKQRQIMLLPRGMNFQTISLAGVDLKLIEKVKLCVCAIADRIKVPANQISIIDAASSKTLANGTELKEGDFNKYQSFERLLNRTFVKFAADPHIGLTLDYSIYNKPQRPTQI